MPSEEEVRHEEESTTTTETVERVSSESAEGAEPAGSDEQASAGSKSE